MQRTLIRDVRGKVGHSVMVRGFVHVVRNQKAVQFLVLRDKAGECRRKIASGLLLHRAGRLGTGLGKAVGVGEGERHLAIV